MNRDIELERLRQENLVLRQTLAIKDEQTKLLKQESHSLQEALKESFQAIKQLREQVKALEEKQTKDSHNSHLPTVLASTNRRVCAKRAKKARRPVGPPGQSLAAIGTGQ
jgi:hypothetical protein